MARQARRIDRKSLKQDPLLNFTTRATEYVNANATLVLSIVAVVVIGIVVLVWWGRGRSEKTEQSDVLAVQALGLFTNGQFQQSLDQSASIRSQFPGSRGAAIAAYVHGKSQLQLGGFVDAERSFRDYLSVSAKEPFFEHAARHGLAASLEGQRRFAEAGQMYEELAAQAPAELADATRLDAARAYELGGAAQQARSLLEAIIAGDGPQARQARVQLAALDAAENAIGEGRVPEPPAPEPGAAAAADSASVAADAGDGQPQEGSEP